MDRDRNAHRGEGGFPVDRPLDALMADHRLVKQMFDRYLDSQDMEEKKGTGPRVLLLLEMHAALEESVFYPRVEEVAPSLVEHCGEEHDQARKMIERLKGMEEGDPQYDLLFRELHDVIMRHVEREESVLFPKIEQAKLDLTDIGMQMQAFEANVMNTQSRRAGHRGMQQ